MSESKIQGNPPNYRWIYRKTLLKIKRNLGGYSLFISLWESRTKRSENVYLKDDDSELIREYVIVVWVKGLWEIFSLGDQEMSEKTKPQGALKRNVSLGHHSFYRRKEESIKSGMDSKIKGN